MKVKIPKIKKKISDYLLSEEGKISKQALLTMGAILGGASIAATLLAKGADAVAYGPCLDDSLCTREIPTDTSPCTTTIHCNSLLLDYSDSAGGATATHAHHSSY